MHPQIIFAEKTNEFDFIGFNQQFAEDNIEEHLRNQTRHLELNKGEVKVFPNTDNSSNNQKVGIDISGKTKQEIYNKCSVNAQSISDLIQSVKSEIYELANLSQLTDLGIEVSTPTYNFIYPADSNYMKPILMKLIDYTEFNIDQEANNPHFNVILNIDTNKKSKLYQQKCIANLKELDYYFSENNTPSNQISIYLLDNENESGTSIGKSENKLLMISKYLKLILEHHDKVRKQTWRKNKNELCFYFIFWDE